MASNSKSWISSTEDLREELECPVCYKIPTTTPIYQCDQGHIHCKTCHPKLQFCPICRIPLTETRALLAEKLLARLTMKCPNNNCNEMLIGEKMVEHEKICQFRSVKCPVLVCHMELPVQEIMEHIQTDHDIVRLNDENVPFIRKNFSLRGGKSLTPERNYWAPCHMRLTDQDFFAQIVIQDHKLYFWIYVVGHEDLAKDFGYKITLFNPENNFEMQFQGPVAAIDSIKDCDTIGSGLVLLPEQYKQFYFQKNKMNFEARIFTAKHFVSLREDLEVPESVRQPAKPAQPAKRPAQAGQLTSILKKTRSSFREAQENLELVDPFESPLSPDENSNE